MSKVSNISKGHKFYIIFWTINNYLYKIKKINKFLIFNQKIPAFKIYLFLFILEAY